MPMRSRFANTAATNARSAAWPVSLFDDRRDRQRFVRRLVRQARHARGGPRRDASASDGTRAGRCSGRSCPCRTDRCRERTALAAAALHRAVRRADRAQQLGVAHAGRRVRKIGVRVEFARIRLKVQPSMTVATYSFYVAARDLLQHLVRRDAGLEFVVAGLEPARQPSTRVIATKPSGATGTPPRFNCSATLFTLLRGLIVTSSDAEPSSSGRVAQ